MTQGFYEQLGADSRASTKEIRGAYHKAAASLARRRKALLDQGGDPSQLDLARTQLEDAWTALSDPARRRRYDAMRALSEDGWTTDADELWEKVAGALIQPAAAAASNLLSQMTRLELGALPKTPGAPRRDEFGQGVQTAGRATRPTIAPDPQEEPTVTATAARLRAPVPAAVADATAAPTPPAAAPAPDHNLRVVAGRSSGPPIIMLHPETASKRSLTPDQVATMVEQHGYSGALLTAVRTARGESLQDIGDTSRISVRYLTAIEADEFDALPSSTFVRGYVREMARLLGLDEDAVVAGYMRRFER
jgi:hypothetical protein